MTAGSGFRFRNDSIGYSPYFSMCAAFMSSKDKSSTRRLASQSTGRH